MKLLVLGGSGVISREIVRQACAAGHEVAVFNRGRRGVALPDGARQLIGDKQDREAFERSMREERFDAVIDMICYSEEDARSLLRAFGGRVDRLLVTSTSAAYFRPFSTIPSTEAGESLLGVPGYDYGYNKSQMERYLLPSLAVPKSDGRMPAAVPLDSSAPQPDAQGSAITVIRPSLTFGEGSANVGVLRQNVGILDRLRRGKELISFGDGTIPWSFTWAGDLARAYLMALDSAATRGRTYHVTSEERHVWDDLYRAFGAAVGVEPVIRHLSAEFFGYVDPAAFDHLVVEKCYAGVFDCAAFHRDVPAWKAEVGLDELARRLADWFQREAPTVDAAKDALEDRLLAMRERWVQDARALGATIGR